ncbi:AMP-binding protein [Sutterella faecalis]|uniref:AMP-binding protein n=2 Tax=Sutterella TaxID=40544 RepID=A0AAI9WMT8_9BURK|nr:MULTISPECIES: AMP-binding protein [Sutterella]KAB7651244.1 AMP-binding protein [Sutterella seckii]QDA53651.1 AMP-binding protein [Sutterella faecalis]
MPSDLIRIRGENIPLSEFQRRGTSPGPRLVKALGENPQGFDVDIARFLEAFLDQSQTVTVHTSGSTGMPKAFQAEKARMRASARMTIGYLGLKPGDTNLLAMPMSYIAGKMVVVRSVECGLDLIPVTPSRNPFESITDPIDLVAVTPMQATSILADPKSAEVFSNSRNILIGGGAVDDLLFGKLQSVRGRVYSTYGMTETLSHIALRRLNGPEREAGYRPLPGVAISLSPKGTLVIHAPAVSPRPLVTNDIARINPDGSFTVRGRLDNVINSGAIKLQIEEIEAKLKKVMKVPFAISSCPSHLYGDEVVLVVEGKPEDVDLEAVRNVLERYENPKRLIATEKLPLTHTMKPDRPAIRMIARNALPL